ncbi:MAG: hypothetical protein P0Y53_18820 [Candidatus Pseudobacter hemicellulosilyticus]|uniref:DUF4468 domain-containing protein n=1 Tax=Candidatus Pseudobacter hemicellulosilyticus TaxID=3121375 RepID=A0AAJ5WR35_9BACT|nr:MAG: hypothetical protein P0Y53_18820 [Pseudobacter sp.]
MKQFYPLLLLLCCSISAVAKDMEGYLVTKDNDTVRIHISRAQLRQFMLSGVSIQVRDQPDRIAVYTVKDINGCGYLEQGRWVHYRVKPVAKGGQYFLELLAEGPNVSVYQYMQNIAMYGGSSVLQEFYTIEKSNGKILYLTNYNPLPDFDKGLKEFFKEYAGIDELIAPLFVRRGKVQEDMQQVMDFVNGKAATAPVAVKP